SLSLSQLEQEAGLRFASANFLSRLSVPRIIHLLPRSRKFVFRLLVSPVGDETQRSHRKRYPSSRRLTARRGGSINLRFKRGGRFSSGRVAGRNTLGNH